ELEADGSEGPSREPVERSHAPVVLGARHTSDEMPAMFLHVVDAFPARWLGAARTLTITTARDSERRSSPVSGSSTSTPVEHSARTNVRWARTCLCLGCVAALMGVLSGRVGRCGSTGKRAGAT